MDHIFLLIIIIISYEFFILFNIKQILKIIFLYIKNFSKFSITKMFQIIKKKKLLKFIQKNYYSLR